VKLSAKAASPVGHQRVTFAESFLSAKVSASGKGPSPRGSLLSAKAPNPVVAGGRVGIPLSSRACSCVPHIPYMVLHDEAPNPGGLSSPDQRAESRAHGPTSGDQY
jgi:hypothetical protein